MSTCSTCGFTYGATARHDLPSRLRAAVSAFAARLAGDGPAVRVRRTPEEWSPLEYGCHVRDVLLMQRDRMYVALVEDEPSFKPMYREERVAFDRYETQSPPVVAEQIAMAADLLSRAFDALDEVQWVRPLIYGFPDPSRRDVEWVAHHTLHELIHHQSDIAHVLDAE